MPSEFYTPSSTGNLQTRSFAASPGVGARSGRRTIAVLMDYMTQFIGSYEARFRTAFAAKCKALDLNLLLIYGGAIGHPGSGSAAQNAVFNLIHPDNADGVILLSTTLASFCGPERLGQFAERFGPFPRCSVGLELLGVPSIVIDNRTAMEAVVEHVVSDHGCRRVAFIAGPPESTESQARFDTYRRVLERHGLGFDPALIAHGYFVGRAGAAAMEEILARGVPFDAVVAANDAMALAAVRILRNRGYRIPRDVLVTGFDDLSAASLASPPLTTVAQPYDDMAEHAIQLVLEQSDGHDVAQCTALPAGLVIRRSCGCGRSASRVRLDAHDDSLDATRHLQEHADSIRAQLAEYLRDGTHDGVHAAARLLEALQAELAGQAETFVQTMEDVIGESECTQELRRGLQQSVAHLREHCKGTADPRLEDMWHEARDAIELSGMSEQIEHRIKLDNAFLNMLEGSEMVSRALDMESLKTALLKALPAIGVETAIISQYPEGTVNELELDVCLLDGCAHEPEPKRYPTSALIPPRAFPDGRRRTLLVFPLVVQTRHLGVALFDYSVRAIGHQMLQHQISAALTSIRLHQEVVEKTTLHERSLQERVASAKRLQSLSVLAGGVAHDLNNALGPLVALPDVILRELDEALSSGDAGNLREDVGSIKAAALRAAQTIKDLLTLGRQGRTTKEPLNLSQVVNTCLSGEAMRFTQLANQQVNVVLDVQDESLVVLASEAHLSRAITNLVRNGVEAIAGHGKVVVRVYRAHVPEPLSRYEAIESGKYAVVSVSDNGSGIEKMELGRIFEPFYSTKRTGEHSGSGLGLAIVHGVVKEHDGFVDVTSELGVGTNFLLYFPCADALVCARKRRSIEPTRGNARVLIVDDEPVQLRTGRRILSRLGYQIDTLESGRRALESFTPAGASGESPYDLVILDMILNEEMDGLELFDRIRASFPRQRAIVVSGHAPPDRAELAFQMGLAWLAKPYTAEELAHAVQSALVDDPESGSFKLSNNSPVRRISSAAPGDSPPE